MKKFNTTHLKSSLIFGFMLSFFTPQVSFANTYLKAGDVTFLSINTNIIKQSKEWCKNKSSFDFVLLEHLKKNSKIYFTNNGWDAQNNFWHKDTFKGAISYTAPQDISKGSILHFDDCTLKEFPSTWNSVGMPIGSSNKFQLKSGNDRLIAFQGTYVNPVFLTAISWVENIGWTSFGKDKGSDIPAGLSLEKKTASTLQNAKNYQYNCSFSKLNDKNVFLTQVFNSQNWKKQETEFPKSNCKINRPPEEILLSDLNFKSGTAGRNIIEITVEDPDANEYHNISFCSAVDNAKFRVSGKNLITNQLFDFENPNDQNQDYKFEICLRASDKSGNYLDKNFTIQMNRGSLGNENDLKPISLDLNEFNQKQKNLAKAADNKQLSSQGRDSKVVFYKDEYGKEKFLGYIKGNISQERLLKKARENTRKGSLRNTRKQKTNIVLDKSLHASADINSVEKIQNQLKKVENNLNKIEKSLNKNRKRIGIRNSEFSNLSEAEKIKKTRALSAQRSKNVQRYTGEYLQNTKYKSRLKASNTLSYDQVKMRKTSTLRNTKFKKKNNLDILKKRRDKKNKKEENDEISYIRIRGGRELEELHDGEILA